MSPEGPAVHAPPGEPALIEFLALYEGGAYFAAHEALERIWRRADTPRMQALQGLIQWAVALEHHRRGNAHGARALLDRAWSRLADAPPGILGLELSPLREAYPALARAFAGWEAGGLRPCVEPPRIVPAKRGNIR